MTEQKYDSTQRPEKLYVIQCRKTGRKFASSEEHVRTVMEAMAKSDHLNAQMELQILKDRFDKMKPGDTLVLLTPEIIMPGDTDAKP